MSRTLATIIVREHISERTLLSFRGRQLADADLSGVDLAGAAMYAIERVEDFEVTSPTARLTTAIGSLAGAKLSGANLSAAVFTDAAIINADLSHANLQAATFVRSQFIRTNLAGANLANARFGYTTFVDCPTLCQAVGLAGAVHVRPSAIDNRTLRSCVNALPDTFLLGFGYTSDEIRSLRALYRTHGPFFSCFISYARQDRAFADQLRARLVESDISCWQDVHDLQAGDYWRRQIDDAIEKHDKLVLVCSRTSLLREAVVAEIIEAIDRERATSVQKLFPVRLDDYIFDGELDTLAKAKVASGEWRENWVSRVRAYHIPDFSAWRDARQFAAEASRLITALRQSDG